MNRSKDKPRQQSLRHGLLAIAVMLTACSVVGVNILLHFCLTKDTRCEYAALPATIWIFLAAIGWVLYITGRHSSTAVVCMLLMCTLGVGTDLFLSHEVLMSSYLNGENRYGINFQQFTHGGEFIEIICYTTLFARMTIAQLIMQIIASHSLSYRECVFLGSTAVCIMHVLMLKSIKCDWGSWIQLPSSRFGEVPTPLGALVNLLLSITFCVLWLELVKRSKQGTESPSHDADRAMDCGQPTSRLLPLELGDTCCSASGAVGTGTGGGQSSEILTAHAAARSLWNENRDALNGAAFSGQWGIGSFPEAKIDPTLGDSIFELEMGHLTGVLDLWDSLPLEQTEDETPPSHTSQSLSESSAEMVPPGGNKVEPSELSEPEQPPKKLSDKGTIKRAREGASQTLPRTRQRAVFSAAPGRSSQPSKQGPTEIQQLSSADLLSLSTDTFVQLRRSNGTTTAHALNPARLELLALAFWEHDVKLGTKMLQDILVAMLPSVAQSEQQGPHKFNKQLVTAAGKGLHLEISMIQTKMPARDWLCRISMAPPESSFDQQGREEHHSKTDHWEPMPKSQSNNLLWVQEDMTRYGQAMKQ